MGRRLRTYVHVAGRAYGPEDDVPAEVAKEITAPGVWEDEPEQVTEAPVEDPAVPDPPAPDPETSTEPEKPTSRRAPRS